MSREMEVPVVGGLRLRSAFQPVVSLAHRRSVGAEALLRAVDATGTAVSPAAALSRLDQLLGPQETARCCWDVHLLNRRVTSQRGWLFLNLSPRAVGVSTELEQTLARALLSAGVAPEEVVVEILETATTDVDEVARFVDAVRRLGCLVAIDDFGAGESNFERVWQLRPDFVKLDRSIVVRAEREAAVRQMLPGLVALLHEARSLVLLEGIETAEQALIAMESNVDFVQGFHFARPDDAPPDDDGLREKIAHLASHFQARVEAHARRERAAIRTYLQAFLECAQRRSAGDSLEVAASDMLALDGVERLYVLNADGTQLGTNVEVYERLKDRRFDPCADASGASWARRPYFRRAVRSPGHIQVSRPYLSVRDGNPCVTMSLAERVGDTLQVLCADVTWEVGEQLSGRDSLPPPPGTPVPPGTQSPSGTDKSRY